MKNKIILIALLIIALLGTTIAFATDSTDDLEVKSNVNVGDLVGEEPTNEVDDEPTDEMEDELQASPISSLDSTQPITQENFEAIEENQIERGDLYILESNVSIKDYVDGNLFVIGDNVDVSADVNGNVFILASNVTLKANVYGSAFVLANNLNYESGQITDVYFYGNSITMHEEAVVSREAKMMADAIKISGTINGDLYTQADSIILDEKGYITGKLVYSGDLIQAYEGQIGSLEKQEINVPVTPTKSTFETNAESILLKTITAIFIIGLIVLMVNNKIETKVTGTDVLKGVVGGFLWIIGIPIIVIILMITIIGAPFALILLLLYIVMLYVAIPVVSLQIAEYILKAKNKDSKVLLWLLGVAIYLVLAILRKLPVVGTILTFIVGTYGFNLILKTLYSKKKKDDKIESNVVSEQ